MATGTDTRTRRIEIRLSEEERQLQEAAAAHMGQTLSEFIRQSASQRAEQVQQEHQRVALSAHAAARFLELLDDETAPPAGLTDLLSRPSRFAT
jgi:uncharacterized protein (DUF1778 family)